MASASSFAAAAWPSATHIAILFVAGVGSHHLIRPFEIDSYVLSLCSAYLAALAAAFLFYFQSVVGLDARTAAAHTFALSSAFNAGLASSILIYRLLFHRLHRFPGPFEAKISRFYAARMHLATQKMHDEYGDFVRTGPRHLSILRPAAIPAIYGPATRCVRSPWYSATPGGLDDLSLLQTREPEPHRRRKKLWERGLSFKALQSYEPRVRAKADLLLTRLAENAGKPIDMTMYGMFYGFDVMSEVGGGYDLPGFSKDFNMLNSQKEHPAIVALHNSLSILAIVGGSLPWLLGMLTRIPGASTGYQEFIEWCGGELQARRTAYKQEKAMSARDKDPSDVVSWLLKAEEEGDVGAPRSNLSWQEEARLFIVAGSLFFLSNNTGCYRKLQSLIDEALKANGGDDGTEVTHEKIKDVAYLDWLVQETLRLKPAVPSGVTRLTPPEGLQIDEVRIPGDTIVVVPMHSIQRDPRYWGGAEDAVRYRPERWEGLSTEKAAWMAFNRGASVCPGKNLAFMKLRLVLAKIAARFEVPEFAPGFDPEAFDRGAEDRFTMHLGKLMLVFTPR
ncbi:hypothetical protein PG994_003093 [Apiospora phragmitis]|uniref:Cytochrome P450 n=1 Tax=Apiospora phragmitis TaxID=2905665 RepID=A0ABR1W728_9PEZI